MMQGAVLEEYADRVYAYAVKKTYTREEAEELSQEILYTAVKELPRLRDESRFEPWLWGIARNVERSFRRRMICRKTWLPMKLLLGVCGIYGDREIPQKHDRKTVLQQFGRREGQLQPSGLRHEGFSWKGIMK